MNYNFTTYSERQVNPLALRPEDIDIRSIAHALALCNRFAGHTNEPISVAQHSVFVSRLCSRETALQGLLHDAQEAYLSDVVRSLKETPEFAAYREAEDRASSVILSFYHQPTELAEDVVEADNLMVRIEAFYGYTNYPLTHPNFLSPSKGELKRVDHLGLDKWKYWLWQDAEKRFLKEFYELMKENSGMKS